jgi:hypothetical protein
MEVNEGLDEPRIEEAPPEAGLEQPPEASLPARPSGVNWPRMAYAFEFLIALLAIFTLWSQVGGQGHLDLMPWYTKLACVSGLAWCCVRFTAAIVEQEKIWNRRSIIWFTGIILLVAIMGGITYYYHLHEEPDEGDSDDTAATSVSLVLLGGPRADYK